MSWQLACLIVLGLVLLGGFAWYERTHPSSRVVALVAAMAVLAVAGRIAFAPIPNVVATTDIVLITGLVLGAAPGFACGALAALVSNFWLGQGTWTPWQMAGWGLVGIAGALIARFISRNPHRLTLAVACALSAFGFGAIMDLSLMTSFGGEQSLDRFLALTVTSLPFTVAHAVGNFAMAMVAGPSLVRMLARLRDRFEFEWAPIAPLVPGRAAAELSGPVLGSLAALSVVISVALVALPGVGSEAEAASSGSAVSYLKQAQNKDGGFGAEPGGASSPEMTGWTALGLEAAGVNPLDVSNKGRTPIDFLRSRAADIRTSGDLERTILALAGAGVDPYDFGGRDLVGDLLSRRRSNGSWEGQVNLTAFGVLALRAAGQDPSTLGESASWLRSLQAKDGGWGINKGAQTEPDSTGAALQALAAAPGRGSAIQDGVRFLERIQRSDGGFELTPGAGSNSQSTAWAVQGAVAGGTSPSSLSKGGVSATDYLGARQTGDGHFAYSKSSDQTPVWVTGQALMASEGRALPLAAVARAPKSPKRDGSSAKAGGNRSGGGRRGKSNRGSKQGGGRNAKGSAGRSAGATEASEPEERLVGDPGPGYVLADPAAATDDGSAPSTQTWVLIGLGVLAAAGFGWLAWRRRQLSG